MEPASGKDRNLQRQIARGSVWSIILRWSVRLTGLISTVILARLLLPADFGIVAIAMLVVGTLEIFAQTGQYDALIRHPNPTREHYDSAWTISVLLGVGLGLIAWALAPLGAAYFHEPRVEPVVDVLALRTMIAGFQNVGIVNFSRQLNYRRQFYFNIVPEFVCLVATLGLAFVLRNYWAPILGLVTQKAIIVVLSYAMESYRPRICFSKIGELWSFSIWSLFRTLGNYIGNQIDKIAIGNFAGAAAMGRYNVARDVAVSPVQELINPMVGVLLPVMARVQDDKERCRTLYLDMLYWSALLAVAASIGVALVAEDLTDVILGPKWHDIWPLMPWFVLSWGIAGLTSSVSAVLLALGYAYESARLQWSRSACYALAIFPAAYVFRSLEAIVITRFLVTLVVAPTIFWVLSRVLEAPMRDFARVLARPLIAGFIMAGAVLALNAAIDLHGPMRLFLDVATAAAAYVTALMVLWVLFRSPRGPERAAWDWAHSRLVPSR